MTNIITLLNIKYHSIKETYPGDRIHVKRASILDKIFKYD